MWHLFHNGQPSHCDEIWYESFALNEFSEFVLDYTGRRHLKSVKENSLDGHTALDFVDYVPGNKGKLCTAWKN